MNHALRRSRPNSPALLGLLLGLGVLGWVPPATAQVNLPEQVVTGGPISPEGLTAIRALVAANKDGLASADADAVRRARQALIAPLREARVTPDFRTAYAAELVETLRPLARSDREQSAVNALVVAGELGTREGIDILTAGLEDKRPAVRARAALGFKRTFVTCRDGVPALLARQVEAALASIEAAADKESDALVLDSLLAAVESAATIPEIRLEGVRDKAVVALVRSATAGMSRLGSPSEASAPLELRATRVLFELLQNQAITLATPSLVQAGGLGGQVLARVACRVKAGELGQGERDRLALITTQAERVVLFAFTRLKLNRDEARLGDAVLKGDDKRLQDAVTQLTGPGGDLTKPPFGLPADRFACK